MLVTAIGNLWRSYRCRRRAVPVEVLVEDPARRLALRRTLLTALRQLERTMGGRPPTRLAVVVQQFINTDHELAGCYQVWQTADGSRSALIRLALQVDGRPLSTDDLLSALGEQYVDLVVQLSERPVVLVPLELGSAQSPSTTPLDPLLPSPNGAHRAAERRAA
ncbi:MAG: hypothetical protein M1401_04120 [Chloroflexi bacterium]|nr:hypothetical protein [Chloroflexota bacterium]